MSHTMEQTSIETRIRQLAQLAGFITSVLAGLSFEQVKFWLNHKTLLRKKLQEIFEITADTYADIRTEWQKFYLDHFGLTVDLSVVQVPEKPVESSWQLMFIPVGLTLNATIAAMRAKFKVWVYNEDLDASVPTNTRTSTTSYAIWVRTGQEPDEKYLGKSTREADMDRKIGMTLLERLVLELKFFVETGKHLDEKGVTLCSGSRDSGGLVPDVYWYEAGGRVDVGWASLGRSNDMDGLRQAVS